MSLCKQCRSRSDATECHIWSESTLLATHAVLETPTDCKMDLFQFRTVWQGVQMSEYSELIQSVGMWKFLAMRKR